MSGRLLLPGASRTAEGYAARRASRGELSFADTQAARYVGAIPVTPLPFPIQSILFRPHHERTNPTVTPSRQDEFPGKRLVSARLRTSSSASVRSWWRRRVLPPGPEPRRIPSTSHGDNVSTMNTPAGLAPAFRQTPPPFPTASLEDGMLMVQMSSCSLIRGV